MAARAAMSVVALNPDGSNIGTIGSTGGSTTALPFAATSSSTNAAPVAAPAAAAALASLTPGVAGTYRIEVDVNVGGTTAAADFSNVQVTFGAVTSRLANGVNASAQFMFQATLTAVQAIAATAVATSTAGSVYGVTITATRVL